MFGNLPNQWYYGEEHEKKYKMKENKGRDI